MKFMKLHHVYYSECQSMFKERQYTQFSLIEDERGKKQYKPIKIPYYCSVHKWATKDDYIEVTVKLTGALIKKCKYCERDKLENKKIKHQEWAKHKEEISDYYVRRTLVTGKKIAPIGMNEYPQELVEAKRAVIKLNREAERLSKPIKTCRTHGDLYLKDLIKSGISHGKQRYKCRACMKDVHAEHYKKNQHKMREKHAQYRKENREIIRNKKREARFKAREKFVSLDRIVKGHVNHISKVNEHKLKRKIIDHKKIEKLPDQYIKRLLTKRSNLTYEDIPQSMIEAKRAVVQLKRTIKNKLDEKFFQYLEGRDK